MPKRKDQKSNKPGGWLNAGIRVPLELTVKQQKYAVRAVGIDRLCFNLALATHQFHRANRLRWPPAIEIAREFNAVKREWYPFITQVSKFVPQGAFRNLERAVANWRNPELPARKPNFKKKKNTVAGSFLAASGIATIKYDGQCRIRLPVIGSLKLSRTLPDGIIPHEVTILKSCGKWYAAIQYWKPPVPPHDRDTQATGGLDVGINPLAAVASGGPESEGQEIPTLKGYYQAERQLRRWQRAQSRRAKSSRGCAEARRRIDQLHRRITGLRNNAHHQLSSALVRQFHTIGIESLNVKGMIAAGLQAKAMTDAGISGLLSKIRYKADWYGTRIVEAAHNFPSSKLCFDCGEINKGLKREKTWVCPSCGVRHDRNLNAARNLHKLALLAVGEDVTLPDGQALVRALIGPDETGPVDGRTETRRQRTCIAQLTLAL